MNEDKSLYKVMGTENLKEALLNELNLGVSARFFVYEVEPLYTSRERQLIQQYMKQYGKLPPGNEEIEELF